MFLLRLLLVVFFMHLRYYFNPQETDHSEYRAEALTDRHKQEKRGSAPPAYLFNTFASSIYIAICGIRSLSTGRYWWLSYWMGMPSTGSGKTGALRALDKRPYGIV